VLALLFVMTGAYSDDEIIYQMDGVKAYQMAEYLSDKFSVNIILSDNLKEKELHGRLTVKDIKSALNSFAWMLNTDYIFKDEIYYFGGKNTVYEVIQSAGINSEVEENFKDQVSVVGDKIVIKGSERDVKNVKDTMQSLTSQNCVDLWLTVIEYTFEINKEIGLSIEPNIVIDGFTFEDLKGGNVDWASLTDQSSVSASYKKDFKVKKVRQIINTSITCISGKQSKLNVGSEKQLEVFSASENFDSVQYKTNYITYSTGFILEFTPYLTNSEWILKTSLEKSSESGELQKNITSLQTSSLINNSQARVITQVNSSDDQKEKSGFLSMFSIFDWLTPSDKKLYRQKIVVICALDIEPVPARKGDNLEPDWFKAGVCGRGVPSAVEKAEQDVNHNRSKQIKLNFRLNGESIPFKTSYIPGFEGRRPKNPTSEP
jgi:hypothetical protein